MVWIGLRAASWAVAIWISQALTARSLEALASMRSEADALILDIWNQVERKYAEVMPNEKRLELCRAYGLIYYYRTGEKEEIAK